MVGMRHIAGRAVLPICLVVTIANLAMAQIVLVKARTMLSASSWGDAGRLSPSAIALQAQPQITPCSTQNPAFAAIYSGTEIGSGSLISSDGIVVTNHHVVAEAIAGKAKPRLLLAGEKEPIVGKVIAFNKVRDIALVKINLPRAIAPFRLSVNSPKPQQAVCAIGNPRNFVTVNKGRLLGLRGADLKAAIALRPGNSGGPLLNEQGEQIGVNKSIWLDATGKPTNVSFATPIAEVMELAQKNNVELH